MDEFIAFIVIAAIAFLALTISGCEFPAKHYYYEGQKVYQCPEARGLECERKTLKKREVIA